MHDFLVSIAPLILDDILVYDGRIHLNVLGGGGVHCLCGCRVWGRKVGLIAKVGQDFDAYLDKLRELGIDASALEYGNHNTTKAWQLYQPGDTRVQVLKDPDIGIPQAIPVLSKLEPHYREASGYHILWRGSQDALIVTLRGLKERNPATTIVMEPTPDTVSDGTAFYRDVFPYVDVFSPNTTEAQLMSGQEEPRDAIAFFLDLGCRAVVLRLGERGSLGASSSGERIEMPAAKATFVDATGAGNAYLGGLLCGMSSQRNLRESMAMGSVSASFEIEDFGPRRFHNGLIESRDQRFRDILQDAVGG